MQDDEPDAELEAVALRELMELRSEHGCLSPQKLAGYSALVRLCGGGDLLDAFFMLRRELRRYQEHGSKYEAAAAWSILADADSVLDRLVETAAHVVPGEDRDQRSARRWSDRGMVVLARDLVYMAQVQGRLGQELLSLDLRGDRSTGLHLVIEQMVSTDLDAIAPEVTLWLLDPDGEPAELDIDLEDYGYAEAAREDYTLRRHRLQLDPVHLERLAPGQSLSISVGGRDAPMRTVFFQDHSHQPDGLELRFVAYRTVVMVEVERKSASDPYRE
jgi:hypothetical protein